MKGEASCMTMVRILATGARSKEEVTEQYAKMARWLLRLHGNCRNGILGAFSRWWRLWRCGILTCCVWLSTTFLFSLNHSQVLRSSFFVKHLKWGVLPHNSYGHILKKKKTKVRRAHKSLVEKPKGKILAGDPGTVCTIP